MFEKLEAVEKRYEELTKMIADPEVISNQSEWQKLMKEHASIEDVVAKFREYKKVKKAMEDAEELMQDPDMKDLAEELGYSREVKEYKASPDSYKGHVGDISTVIRVKLTGRCNTPDLYEIMKVLGKDEVLRRI